MAMAAKEKKNSALASALLKYDTNKNGVLDAEEIEALKKDYVNNKPDALKKYDANNNGQIDEGEVAAIKTDFAAAVAKHRKKKKETQ